MSQNNRIPTHATIVRDLAITAILLTLSLLEFPLRLNLLQFVIVPLIGGLLGYRIVLAKRAFKEGVREAAGDAPSARPK